MTKTLTLVVFCISALSMGHVPTAFGNPAVQAEVERVLLAQARKSWPDATITVEARIDPRLRLATCSDLEVLARGQQKIGRVHVAVRCGAPQAWSVYLPADVNVSAPVLVAARPLVRGQQLTASDIKETMMPLNGHVMALVNRQSLQGLSPRRPIAEGAVLTLPLFAQVRAVARNDVVRILSGSGVVRIETKGKAMESGQIGDQVMVENLNSGRRVAAWVLGPGLVSTRPQESL
jgi:flagellar basal body P-ring formation protein FlgA